MNPCKEKITNSGNHNKVEDLLRVLENSSKNYTECFSSPYYSGCTSFKSKSTRNHESQVFKKKRMIKLSNSFKHNIDDSTCTQKSKESIFPNNRSSSHGIGDTTNNNKIMVEKKKKYVNIEKEICTIRDLLTLCHLYPLDAETQYNINMEALHDIKEPLEQMDAMIGLENIKLNLVDQIVYYLQGLHMISPTESSNDFMHTVIYGPPGTGKTEIAKIIGNIFSKIGVLKNKVFKKVTRDDLIAGYLGQTAMKTKDIIKECIGGVLFIDEAYSLGNAEKRDSFSKECIDTLCESLSAHKGEFMCIIAGYKEEIQDCFFKVNDGLESRFPWQYTIGDYSADELRNIFNNKVKIAGWSLGFAVDNKWFQDNLDCFRFFGRDMETLLSKVKIAHSKRVFCLPSEHKTIITEEDIKSGFNNFTQSENVKTRSEKSRIKSSIHNSMYV